MFGVCCLLLLAACKAHLELSLASADERLPRPMFVAGNTGDTFRLIGISVSDLTDKTQDVVWQTDVKESAARALPAQFTYGEQLAGLEVRVVPKPLQPNHEYYLGVGALSTDLFGRKSKVIGSIRFKVDDEGRVHALD